MCTTSRGPARSRMGASAPSLAFDKVRFETMRERVKVQSHALSIQRKMVSLTQAAGAMPVGPLPGNEHLWRWVLLVEGYQSGGSSHPVVTFGSGTT